MDNNLPSPKLNVSTKDTSDYWEIIYTIIIIIIAIVILIFIFAIPIEGFMGTNPNPLPKLSNIPKELPKENKDRAIKIIQKINKIDKKISENESINSQYSDIDNKEYLEKLNTDIIDQKENFSNLSFNKNDQKENFSNLSFNKNDQKEDFSHLSTDMNKTLNFNQMSNVNKTSDGSTNLMNKIGYVDAKPVSCNMLGVNSANMDEYKKKFYSMYSHQIECPKNCNLKADGMSKGCGMGSKCGIGSKCGTNQDCSNVNTDTSIPDVFALNYLALNNANKKSCVTCNFKPTKNPLNREWMEREYPSYDGLPEDVKMADNARLKKMNQIDANVSNYVNFENNVYQDSIGVSGADKINEIRTCQDAYGTCALKDYGISIANAYDKLTANPAYTSRNSCDPYQLTGILEDAAPTDMYESV